MRPDATPSTSFRTKEKRVRAQMGGNLRISTFEHVNCLLKTLTDLPTLVPESCKIVITRHSTELDKVNLLVRLFDTKRHGRPFE